MATFKICARVKRTDGFYPVYIRVTHQRKTTYIKTDKVINNKGLTRTGEVKDPIAMLYCSELIQKYVDMINKVDISNWDVKELVEYLQKDMDDVCFSDFARKYSNEIEDKGEVRNAKNYRAAYRHIELFAGTNQLMFSRFTTKFINDWIASLQNTSRAKEMYPVIIRQIFRAAINEYNDYDKGIIYIKTNPWPKIKIPKSDSPEHRAVEVKDLRNFFNLPAPPSRMILPLPSLAKDVAMMVFCLAGINTVDLYRMKKSNMKDWVIGYNRAKTEKFRKDRAYLEITVPEILRPVVTKYLADEDDDYLFNFHIKYSTEDSFNANINVGLKRFCEHHGINGLCVYNFRHSWGTIAKNDIKASMTDVAFCMNHSSAHKTTEIYVKPDYSIVTEINDKVVNFVFFNKKSEMVYDDGAKFLPDEHMKISAKQMIRGSIIYKNNEIFSFTDIGYNNIDEVIDKLVEYVPSFVPDRAIVDFRIDNLDKGMFRIYQRQKGKGF